MPGRDGTGPQGLGSMTGRGMGYCRNDAGMGRGRGPVGRGLGRRMARAAGRGLGRRCGWNDTAYEIGPDPIQEERQLLQDQIQVLQNQINEIHQHLTQLAAK